MVGVLVMTALSAGLLPQPQLAVLRPRLQQRVVPPQNALVLRGGAGPLQGVEPTPACAGGLLPVLTHERVWMFPHRRTRHPRRRVFVVPRDRSGPHQERHGVAIFALSDQTAQRIEGGGNDGKRTLTSALVGLLYFGPALHFWLEMIQRVVPGFAILDTLKKTLLGQCFFGPTITCIFFGASLIANSGLLAGLQQWPKKIKQDLLVTWASGLCFWPFVQYCFMLKFTFCLVHFG